MKKPILIFAIILVSVIASYPFLKKEFNHSNVSITVSEDEDEFELTAKFPQGQSQKIHNLLENSLALKHSIDLDKVEIEQFSTPNKSMSFYIKSREDYLKIILDKHHNSSNSVKKLKELSEEIKKALAS